MGTNRIRFFSEAKYWSSPHQRRPIIQSTRAARDDACWGYEVKLISCVPR